MSSPQVFISYSRADKEFADRLRLDLLSIGLSVWKDDKDIIPGDSSSKSIEQAINTSDYFLLVLSLSSTSSNWVDREYRSALQSQMEKGKPQIVPIRLREVEPPALLRDIQYSDFVSDYATGWKDLSSLFPTTDLRTLRLGGGTGAGFYILKLFMAKFREIYPNFHVEQRSDISEELIRSVSSRNVETNLDAAVVGKFPSADSEQNLEYNEVFRDVSVLTVFPNHPLWGTESISEQNLLSVLRDEIVFISRPKGSGLYEAMVNYLEPRLGSSETDALLSRFVAYDLDSLKRFVSEGRGISIMPKVIVNEDVLSGKIWAVGLPGNVARPFWGVWAKNRRRSPVAEEFIMLLKTGLE
jgi:DNA-binding transcriptional LysR family regulator